MTRTTEEQLIEFAGDEPEEREAVARIVSSGHHGFPLLEWLSADHSFRAPIGSLLYAAVSPEDKESP